VIVLDASAAVDGLLGTAPYASIIHPILHEHAGEVHAPHLLDAEVGSVLRRYVLGRRMSVERAERVIDRLGQLGITRYPHLPLLPRAMGLLRSLTVYDGLYVALAEALGAPLVTRDASMARVARRLVDVKVIR